MISTEVTGIREALNTLAKFDKELTKELRLDLAKVAQPLTSAILARIPTHPPIRGFDHKGRTSWPTKPVKVRTKLNTSTSFRQMRTSTVKIIISNGGVEIADMAGKRNDIKYSGMTRAYAKGSVIMSHRINGQGKSMIQALSSTGVGRASRYVYPAVDKYRDTITMEIDKTVQQAIKIGSERLKQRVA
jgi:hypothetical protein